MSIFNLKGIVQDRCNSKLKHSVETSTIGKMWHEQLMVNTVKRKNPVSEGLSNKQAPIHLLGKLRGGKSILDRGEDFKLSSKLRSDRHV